MQVTIESVYVSEIILDNDWYFPFSSTRQTTEAKYKLTVEELSLFYEQIESLPCTIKEAEGVKELLDHVKEFQKEASDLLSQEMPESKSVDKFLCQFF